MLINVHLTHHSMNKVLNQHNVLQIVELKYTTMIQSWIHMNVYHNVMVTMLNQQTVLQLVLRIVDFIKIHQNHIKNVHQTKTSVQQIISINQVKLVKNVFLNVHIKKTQHINTSNKLVKNQILYISVSKHVKVKYGIQMVNN